MAARSLAGQAPIWIEHCTLSCGAGLGLQAVRSAIASQRSALRPNDWPTLKTTAHVGRVPDGFDRDWQATMARWDSRNNRLALAGLLQDGFADAVRIAIAHVGVARVGLLVGTSTSSIGRTEEGYTRLLPSGTLRTEYLQPIVHTPHGTAAFLAEWLQLTGPVMTISTACSSSAKILASAARWLAADLVDTVIVAGVDSLCRSTIHGFHSLQLLSAGLCRPFDRARDGLNIGEAAAFALLSRSPGPAPVGRLLGYGESSDAHHMSSPHPQGLGAQQAMRTALAQAQLQSEQLGYVNLHGTGTRTNDSVESLAMTAVFAQGVAASSTKGFTGHTLGAAGLVEAVLTLDVFHSGILPGTVNLEQQDTDTPFPVLRSNSRARVDYAMSNSFGFGGSNCSLVFGRPN
jgi:3-oxoacyl-[acyl-carrier-protein] synthase I